jgi:hypothetical protein
MPIHLGRSSGDVQDQTREARRFLQDHVRSDWSYPNAPHVLPYDYPTATSFVSTPPQQDATSRVQTHVTSHATTSNTTRTPLGFTPTGWAERTYSDVESSDDADTSINAPQPVYETPDSVGSTLAERKRRRHLRRQKRLQDEMAWNIGLAHWSARRNTWTCAQHGASTTISTPTESTTTRLPIQDSDLLLPLPTPILPNHPIRNNVTSHTHGEIYTKIILQGRTPSIPLNLSDVTKSLIHGWKEEGNWPPKPTPAEASLVKKKKGGEEQGGGGGGGGDRKMLRKGVAAVGRVLGLRGGPGVPVEPGKGQGQI